MDRKREYKWPDGRLQRRGCLPSCRVFQDKLLRVACVELARESCLAPALLLRAGSERIAKSEVAGQQLKEAQAINRSLSALGDVVAALQAKGGHVPYRNSKLTQVGAGLGRLSCYQPELFRVALLAVELIFMFTGLRR
jgi:hypothetical protein